MDVKEKFERIELFKKDFFGEIEKKIVGQREVISKIIITILSQGHAIITGVPGLAKTLIVKTISDTMDLEFSRIQFTPDLMPSDIIGTDIIEEDPESGRRYFKFVKGPVFANLILADEINRTPPKTQSALLEAMQESKVTVSGKNYELPLPFSVIATQNPIEHEGTYPLPEAQLDRFMFNILIDYPDESEERDIVSLTTGEESQYTKKIVNRKDIFAMQSLVRQMPVPDHVLKYAVKIARSTRPQLKESPEIVGSYVRYGVGPRASQFMILGAKARALIEGRTVPTTEDVRYIIPDVLRHRIILNFAAEADNVDKENVIRNIIEHVSR